jgi:PKD repeat protein
MDYIPASPPEEISEKPQASTNLNAEFNWMDYNGNDWTTPAKNQGPCGSCWAFAAVSCLESVINIAWDDPDLDIDLSEQYILSCLSRAGSCGGGNSYSAFKYIQRNDTSGNNYNGIITEECLIYQADDSVPCSEKTSDWKQKLVPIASYGYWQATYPEDCDAIKTELINKGPLVTYFQATGSFSHWGGTHHSPDDYYPFEQGQGANHAIIIVGYKDDPSIENGGYWICKNSWGTDWGYNGFFNIVYGSLNIDNVEITWVEYKPIPIVEFSYSPKSPMAGELIQFNDTSTCLKGAINSWNWEFGDGTSSTEKNPIKRYDDIGVYNLKLTISDDLGNTNAIVKNIYIGDDTSPTTSHVITGIKGENDWFTSHIGIKLTASDSFSGIDYIMYSIDGAGYQKYIRSLILNGKSYQGSHTISYYSIDKAGNVEEEKTCSFKIDFSNPQASIEKPVKNMLYFFNMPFYIYMNETIVFGPFSPKLEIYDEVSGIAKVEYYLNNKLIDVDTNPPYICIINRLHMGKDCSFFIKVYDNAGRSAESETIYFKQYSFGLIRNLF